MAELKTKKTSASVDAFLDKNTEGERKADCLGDIDVKVLKELVKESVAHMKANYPTKF